MVRRLHDKHHLTCLAFAHDDDDLDGARELVRMGLRIVVVPYRPYLGIAKSLYALLARRPLTTAFFGSSRFASELRSRMHATDLAIAFSSSMGAYLLPWPAVPRILHFCELDSDKWRQYAERTRPPMRWIYAREARVLEELERRLAFAMSANLVCTDVEQKLFARRIPGAACTVMRNGVDLDYFSPVGLTPERGLVVFTGVMNYYPNVEGCAWFVREVLPRLRATHPDARLTIVGANPSRAVRSLSAHPHVDVTGRVPDTRVHQRRAAVIIAPLRIGRGIQNKVLEGLAMGVPVVGTSLATQGVGGTPGRDYLVADDPPAMAAAIGRLLSDERERLAQGARGRAFVEQHYDWDRSLDRLDDLIENIVGPRAAGVTDVRAPAD